VTNTPCGQADWCLEGIGGCRWSVVVLFSWRSSSRTPRATTPSQSEHGLGRGRRRPVSASVGSSQGSPRGSPALLGTRPIRPLPPLPQPRRMPPRTPPQRMPPGTLPRRLRPGRAPRPRRLRPGTPQPWRLRPRTPRPGTAPARAPRPLSRGRCSTGWRWPLPQRRRRSGNPRGAMLMTGSGRRWPVSVGCGVPSSGSRSPWPGRSCSGGPRTRTGAPRSTGWSRPPARRRRDLRCSMWPRCCGWRRDARGRLRRVSRSRRRSVPGRCRWQGRAGGPFRLRRRGGGRARHLGR